MSTVTSSTSASGAASLSSSSGTSAAQLQDQFLTLLVTQLKNQDPLSPMDNASITSQMAQFSMAAGVSDLKDALSSVSSQIDMGQAIDAAALVGKGVLVPGNKIAVGTGEDGQTAVTPFGVDLEASAASVIVKINDKNGNTVRTLDLGAQDGANVLALSWDGKTDGGEAAADGAYYAQVVATNADGLAVASKTLASGTVGSVVYTADGLRLDLGLSGRFSLLDVYRIQ